VIVHKRLVVTAAVWLVTTGLAGKAPAETIRVEAKGLVFSPAALTAHVGDTIEWVNADFVAHTATARNGEWDVKLPPHATGRTVFNAPGKLEYYCRYHPNMKGQITVEER
jgi:plastocyanin